MPRLLVVHHTPSPALQEMFEAVVSGARTDEIDGVDVVIAGPDRGGRRRARGRRLPARHPGTKRVRYSIREHSATLDGSRASRLRFVSSPLR